MMQLTAIMFYLFIFVICSDRFLDSNSFTTYDYKNCQSG